MLADRLTRAEQDGLVVADRGTGGGRARCYRPASKAPGLLPVLLEIIAWSAAHDPATAAARPSSPVCAVTGPAWNAASKTR